MSMKTEILSALEQNGDEPMTSEEVIAQVHRQSGIHWKGSSIQKALGQLVTKGEVANLCRDAKTGRHATSPCTYGLPS